MELLASLAREAAEAAEERGDPPLEDGEDDWSASERAILEMVACAIDRRVDLDARYRAAAEDDVKLRIELSKESRQLSAHVATLLKQVKTDLPAAPSVTSQKASRAANTRWKRDGQGSA